MCAAKANPSIYQLKITLLDIIRPIWRRIQVPSTIPLSRLHDVFQTVMGWTNRHLHQFDKGRVYWSVPQRDGLDDDAIDERRGELDTVLSTEGDSLPYCTTSETIGGIRLYWRRFCHWTPPPVRSRSALQVNVVARPKKLAVLQGIWSFWRSSSSLGTRNSTISVVRPVGRSMRRSLM